jgi:flagellar motor protein MotB
MNNNDEDTELPDETSQDEDSAGAGSGPEGDDPVVTEAGALPYEFHDGTEDLLSHRVFPEGDVFYRRRAPKNTHWSIAWSDLMMTMFIFFVVLYAYQAAHREFIIGEGLGTDIGSGVGTGVFGEGGGGGIGDTTLPAEQVGPKFFDLSELVQTREAETLREFASVELAADETVRIILTSDLLFDLGQAKVKPKARQRLQQIAELIRRTPNVVNVIGHTDNIPMSSARFPTNWELSVLRATAVTRFLTEEMKLAGNRFYVSGHAYHQPLKPNSTARNRAANRRVEIVITKEVPQATPGIVGDIL